MALSQLCQQKSFLVCGDANEVLCFCRLQTAVHGGDCDSECDDQLQHLVSVHIRSRYSQEYAVNANDTDFRHVGPEHHRPASYMHFALDKWYMKFRKARGLATY